MIEHFQKFDSGDKKKLLPLSFSHLNEFAFYRERWALRRIFGYEFPSSAAAERGKAVESGLNLILNGFDIKEAKKLMLDEYDANCSRINDPKVDEERTNLIPFLTFGAKKFQEHAFQWNLIDYQKQVEVFIKGIPFKGFTDFHFEDKNTKEDFYIDLKTSNKSAQFTMSYAMQQSIYQRATNARQMLWHLKSPSKAKNPKIVGPQFTQLELSDYGPPMRVCEHIVLVMGKYLETVNSPEDVKNSLIPNPDNWIWKEETVLKARKEICGY